MVHPTSKGIPPLRPSHPRSDQAPTENDRHPRKLPPEKADEGEGGQGLTQVIEGEADEAGLLSLEKTEKPLAEKGVERVLFRVRSGPKKILAPYRRKAVRLIVRKAQTNSPLPSRPLQKAIKIQDGPLIAIEVLVSRPASEMGQVTGKVTQSPPTPGIGTLR